jgi:hypothetical protein
MLFYRAALPLSRQTLAFVSGLVRTHRRVIGSPWRALNSGQQALLVLVHLCTGEPFAEVGAGFGVSTTTCWRYVNETVELLARRAPKLRAALRKAEREGMAYVIIDGTLIPIDRIAADRPFYSGKHKRHGVNLQVIASPDGTILWVSGELPGSTHDTAAARIWNILAMLRDAGLIALGDKGYHGYDEAGHHVITPYKGKNKPESQKDAKPRPRPATRPRRTRPRPAQVLADPAQSPYQPTPHRPTRQSHPRAPELRNHRRMKKAQCPQQTQARMRFSASATLAGRHPTEAVLFDVAAAARQPRSSTGPSPIGNCEKGTADEELAAL